MSTVEEKNIIITIDFGAGYAYRWTWNTNIFVGCTEISHFWVYENDFMEKYTNACDYERIEN